MPTHFEDLNWMDVERYLEHDDRIVLTVGACEQHGYLSLLTDTKIAVAVARAVCADEGILMAPTLPFGVSLDWVAFPGTLTLTPSTFIGLVQELIEGLWNHGFRRILLNNGHGGNMASLEFVQVEFNNTHPNARVGYFSWYNHPTVWKVIKEEGLSPNHGGWSENFSFTRVGPVPEGVKEDIHEWPRAAAASDYRQVLGDGVTGGPYQVSGEIMDRIFAAAVEAMKEELSHLDRVFLEKAKKANA